MDEAEQLDLLRRYCEVLTSSIHQNFERIDYEILCAAFGYLITDALANIPDHARVEVATAIHERIK